MDFSKIFDDFLKGLQGIGGVYQEYKEGEIKETFFKDFGKVLPLLIIALAVVLVFAFRKA